ncbi:MAG TPA: DUF4252 domain-containing protein [Thermoanaerobaculia bacterium]|nr:DUF4252 domain-containing protein [Thermoanaerobaculia bacterium]
MHKPIVLTLILLCLAAAGWAQPLESQPGYVPIEELGLFPRDKLEVEIDIEGPVLHMVSAMTRKDDPGFAAVMDGLKSIQVQVFPVKGIDTGGIKARIDRAVHWLEGHGWKSSVRVRDQGQETYIYLKQTGDRIDGLTLLSLDPKDEAVVINIVGRIDPAQLGRLGQSLDVPQLKKIPTGKKKPE